MSRREKSTLDHVRVFVKAHLGKDCFAAFTGTDSRAWSAFVYLVELYSVSGQTQALDAMRWTVRCAQRKEDVLRVFVQAIPAVMDWGDVARLWPTIVRGGPSDQLAQSGYHSLSAIERREVSAGRFDVVLHGVLRSVPDVGGGHGG